VSHPREQVDTAALNEVSACEAAFGLAAPAGTGPAAPVLPGRPTKWQVCSPGRPVWGGWGGGGGR
jgi:hypothetical protein